jgi:hypothetical protein
MKQYQCVQVNHHEDIGRTIEEYQKNGWLLHTYQATATLTSLVAPIVSHYLLFEKDAE